MKELKPHNLEPGADGTVLTTVAGKAAWAGASATTDPETVRDVIAAALVAGSGVTVTVNDAGDTITLTATTDPEVVRDTLGSALVAGSGVTIVVDDAANTVTINAPARPAVVPLTTVVGGVPELVWDSANNLVMTEVAG